jgi:hypothetical protein
MLNSQGEIAELIEDGWTLVGMVQKPNDKPLKQGWREPNIKGVDKNWQDCKDRVSGVSSAKYKKSLDEEDEKKIIEEFSK